MDSRRILGILDGLSLFFLDPGRIFGILDGSIGISSDPVDYCLLYLILLGFVLGSFGTWEDCHLQSYRFRIFF